MKGIAACKASCNTAQSSTTDLLLVACRDLPLEGAAACCAGSAQHAAGSRTYCSVSCAALGPRTIAAAQTLESACYPCACRHAEVTTECLRQPCLLINGDLALVIPDSKERERSVLNGNFSRLLRYAFTVSPRSVASSILFSHRILLLFSSQRLAGPFLVKVF